jgi:hypothetical protein
LRGRVVGGGSSFMKSGLSSSASVPLSLPVTDTATPALVPTPASEAVLAVVFSEGGESECRLC